MQRISIYNKDDRLTVAKILVDNGYRVSQGKERETPTSKKYDYYVEYEKKGESNVTGG